MSAAKKSDISLIAEATDTKLRQPSGTQSSPVVCENRLSPPTRLRGISEVLARYGLCADLRLFVKTTDGRIFRVPSVVGSKLGTSAREPRTRRPRKFGADRPSDLASGPFSGFCPARSDTSRGLPWPDRPKYRHVRKCPKS